MNKKDLHKALIKFAPFEEATGDYRESLSKALRKMKEAAAVLDSNDRPQNWKDVLQQIDYTSKKLKDIATNSYKGLPSTAYAQLSNLMGKRMQDKLLWKTFSTETNFFRMRTFVDRRNGIDYKEMFHVPITMRRQVGTERFSTPGYPCLYLGNSSYVCWEEMGRPQMSVCWCSRLKNVESFKVLDLHVPSEEEFDDKMSQYLVLMPLIIACMLPIRGKSSDVFKPEYLIPQLIMEWIIKNEKVGVYYTTTHLTSQTRIDFSYPDEKYNNIALPIRSPLLKGVENCPELANVFEITNPANYEIETLKHGDGMVMINMAEDQKKENYRTSTFGILESFLLEDFDLHKI